FRIGRFKTPFLYEFYAVPTPALANGEWSLFFNNFALNRGFGAMLWGRLFRDRLDYAVGLFDETPNGVLDLGNRKDVIAFLNVLPFKPWTDSPLENFNVGGSVVAGGEQQVPVPQTLRTLVPTAGNNVIGVPPEL